MPSNSLFDISSLVFNIRTHKQETFSKYTCYYQQDNDILCFILDEKAKRSHLTKEVMTNFMEFANKICVKAIIILLSNKNKEYYNLLMDLLTFGFVRDEKMPITTIENKQFKVMQGGFKSLDELLEFGYKINDGKDDENVRKKI